MEATLLVKPLGPLPRQVLAVLSTSAEAIEGGELSSTLNAPVEEIQNAVSRVNSFAEAFGFVPLISSEESGGFYIDASAARVVSAALERTEQR